MSEDKRKARMPPRWVVLTAWYIHRGIFRVTGGRAGLRQPKPGRYGMFRLTTVGRRTGKERSVILGYYEDGDNAVTMAMNGWGEGEPAWWLNLQANPDATAEFPDGTRHVRGRAAHGEEHERLWERWQQIDKQLDDYAALRSTPTAVVILEPRTAGEARSEP